MSTEIVDTLDTVDIIETAARRPSRWQRLPIAARVAIIVIGAVIALNLIARFVTDSTGGGSPSGRQSSAYGTQNDGLAAYADLLRTEGHPVVRTRGAVESTDFDPATTVVVLDPDTLSRDDAGVLLTFVVNGGRLVTGGQTPRYFTALRDNPPQWAAGGAQHWNTVAPALAPIQRVESVGNGAFVASGTSTPIVGDRAEALVTEERVGRGTIDFVADASVLQNRLLGTADNAALGLALAGEPGRTIVFPEAVHGYGAASGLRAIPTDWKWALAGLTLAGLVLMWARGRRLGPPEDTSRPLPPPRAAYVDAVGSTLMRTNRPDDALRAVADRVRAEVESRASAGTLDPEDSPRRLDGAEFARRARAMGLTDDEIIALQAPISEASVLAVGRALSRVAPVTGREGQ